MRQFWIVAGLFIAEIAIVGSLMTDVQAQSPPWDTLRIIVEFRDRARMDDVDSLLGGNGFSPEKSLSDTTTFLVRIPKEWTIEEAIENVSRRESVEFAGPNHYCHLPEATQISQAFLDADSDPFVSGVSPNAYYSQYASSRLSIPEGLQMATGDGQTIAQIDNGVDFDHPALAGRLSVSGYDFVDSDSYPGYEIGEYTGHGTFSAGLIALGAPGAEILPLRALNSDGRGAVFDICLGIEHSVALEADVLCLGFSMGVDDRFLRSAIRRADSSGVLIVAPAGNDSSSSLVYPAVYPEVLGVAATDEFDIRASFSNFGASVDVCAPGVNVYSALPGGDVWGTWSGTSFAAPLAAALTSLVRQLHPSVPATGCSEIIRWSCERIDSLNGSFAGMLGEGRVDYARASGYSAPVVAIWGHVTDATGVPHPNVVIELSLSGIVLPRSTAVTDSAGSYATAATIGNLDIAFIPPPTTGHETWRQSDVPLMTDTTIHVVLVDVRRGDMNIDGMYDVLDVIELIEYAFRAGTAPQPVSIADPTCDNVCNVVDVVYLIGYIFRYGPAPLCP